ncbi:hypothetical protein E2C01_013674 [Portunus trituberculatus]|uniref:Uncharacterized protein n=1 Tax=Portunus trituberculatus TaxID=210409 RepID=A0A5B7DHA1_PORTR|nr:hypothetical protein [Portunus trituberculatus]
MDAAQHRKETSNLKSRECMCMDFLASTSLALTDAGFTRQAMADPARLSAPEGRLRGKDSCDLPRPSEKDVRGEQRKAQRSPKTLQDAGERKERRMGGEGR